MITVDAIIKLVSFGIALKRCGIVWCMPSMVAMVFNAWMSTPSLWKETNARSFMCSLVPKEDVTQLVLVPLAR